MSASRLATVWLLGLSILCLVFPAGGQTPATAPAKPAATASQSQPAAKMLTLELPKGAKLKLVLIPAGKFVMGERGLDNEKPHPVTITKPFYMGVYEVTQEQYEAVMAANPSHTKGPQKPAESMDWDKAKDFCDKLAAATGHNVTLPTEAQWEYACRAGTNTRFYYGDDPDYADLADHAWYARNSHQTHPVGQKSPNPWGLYDMIGNVWEWCSDWYAKTYPAGDAVDPTGPASGTDRVLRGGCWGIAKQGCRCARRARFQSNTRLDVCGFRVAVDVK